MILDDDPSGRIPPQLEPGTTTDLDLVASVRPLLGDNTGSRAGDVRLGPARSRVVHLAGQVLSVLVAAAITGSMVFLVVRAVAGPAGDLGTDSDLDADGSGAADLTVIQPGPGPNGAGDADSSRSGSYRSEPGGAPGSLASPVDLTDVGPAGQGRASTIGGASPPEPTAAMLPDELQVAAPVSLTETTPPADDLAGATIGANPDGSASSATPGDPGSPANDGLPDPDAATDLDPDATSLGPTIDPDLDPVIDPGPALDGTALDGTALDGTTSPLSGPATTTPGQRSITVSTSVTPAPTITDRSATSAPASDPRSSPTTVAKAVGRGPSTTTGVGTTIVATTPADPASTGHGTGPQPPDRLNGSPLDRSSLYWNTPTRIRAPAVPGATRYCWIITRGDVTSRQFCDADRRWTVWPGSSIRGGIDTGPATVEAIVYRGATVIGRQTVAIELN